MKSARAFFEGLNQREDTRAVLSDLDQTIRFLVADGESFRIEVSGGALTFAEGAGSPETRNHPDFTHFETDRETIRRLFGREPTTWARRRDPRSKPHQLPG